MLETDFEDQRIGNIPQTAYCKKLEHNEAVDIKASDGLSIEDKCALRINELIGTLNLFEYMFNDYDSIGKETKSWADTIYSHIYEIERLIQIYLEGKEKEVDGVQDDEFDYEQEDEAITVQESKYEHDDLCHDLKMTANHLEETLNQNILDSCFDALDCDSNIDMGKFIDSVHEKLNDEIDHITKAGFNLYHTLIRAE
jgi:hypothetical protein